MYLLEILIKLGHTLQDLKCTGEEMHLMRLKIETRYTLPPTPQASQAGKACENSVPEQLFTRREGRGERGKNGEAQAR